MLNKLIGFMTCFFFLTRETDRRSSHFCLERTDAFHSHEIRFALP